MKVRFQADADFNEIIAKGGDRGEPAIDFQTANAAGFVGLSDKEVLALAARSGRLLATHDRKTMPRHFAEFIATTPGIAFQRPMGRSTSRLSSVALQVEDQVIIVGSPVPVFQPMGILVGMV